jgi:hypothetical protein
MPIFLFACFAPLREEIILKLVQCLYPIDSLRICAMDALAFLPETQNPKPVL